jgi:hypothetical protein
MSVDLLLLAILTLLGLGFLAANVHVFLQVRQFRRLRPSALLTWPGPAPPFYRFLLVLGALLAVLVVFKIGVQHRPPWHAFGEAMMSLYYAYALPLSLRIGRGFYANGIWAESGFLPYSRIDGLRWRESAPPTLVVIDRGRQLARTLAVPEAHYGAARRLLRDRIGAHEIMFAGKSLDLGAHDERDDV